MKRVRSACICQTLVFAQSEEADYSKDFALKINREEFEKYKKNLDRTRTKYVVTSVEETENGAVVAKVKKQYNEKCDVSEYF